jgi:hypothetical protein
VVKRTPEERATEAASAGIFHRCLALKATHIKLPRKAIEMAARVADRVDRPANKFKLNPVRYPPEFDQEACDAQGSLLHVRCLNVSACYVSDE